MQYVRMRGVSASMPGGHLAHGSFDVEDGPAVAPSLIYLENSDVGRRTRLQPLC